jgi:hypothetical protein
MAQHLRPRTYELRRGGWIEIDEPRRPLSGWRRIGAFIATAFVIAALAAIGITASAIAVLLLPFGLLFAWIARRARTS